MLLSEVPLQRPQAAPLLCLSGDQWLGIDSAVRTGTARSRQARLVTAIKSRKIQSKLLSVRNKEQLKFH